MVEGEMVQAFLLPQMFQFCSCKDRKMEWIGNAFGRIISFAGCLASDIFVPFPRVCRYAAMAVALRRDGNGMPCVAALPLRRSEMAVTA